MLIPAQEFIYTWKGIDIWRKGRKIIGTNANGTIAFICAYLLPFGVRPRNRKELNALPSPADDILTN